MASKLAKDNRPKSSSGGFDGAKLRELREAAGLTLTVLAEAAGISAADVSRYERGLVTPSADVLFRLADALDVQPGELRADPPATGGKPKKRPPKK